MRISASRVEMEMARRELQLSELARLSGVSKQNLSQIIRRGSCYPKTAGRLARALDVDISAIVETVKEGTHE